MSLKGRVQRLMRNQARTRAAVVVDTATLAAHVLDDVLTDAEAESVREMWPSFACDIAREALNRRDAVANQLDGQPLWYEQPGALARATPAGIEAAKNEVLAERAGGGGGR